jgi:hypothetical protein
MGELNAGLKLGLSDRFKICVRHLQRAQTTLVGDPSYSATSREVGRILRDMITCKAMFDLTENIPLRDDSRWSVTVGTFPNNSTINRITGYIEANPELVVAYAFHVTDRDQAPCTPDGWNYSEDNIGGHYTSPWKTDAGYTDLQTAGTWYITIDGIESEAPGYRWMGECPRHQPGMAGAWANQPQCEEGHLWTKVRWVYANDRFHFEFEWTHGALGPIAVKNAVFVSGPSWGDN